MTATVVERRIGPQPGPQETFASTSADIAIYGGSAGGGKTWSLLFEPLRHIHNPGFGAVCFRREATTITNEGGLWDEAMRLYPLVRGVPIQSPAHRFKWDGGGRVTFGHLNQEQSVFSWHGAQIPLLMFDELQQFTEFQFFYMLSRNRSTCGVRPYVRATCNPDPDSFLAKFIAWWIDQETGYAIEERSGVIRYFVRVNDTVLWGDSPAELVERYDIPVEDVKSVTFIRARLEDNQILLKADPGYRSNLRAQGRVQRERLLEGNWKIRPAAGLYFPRSAVTILDSVPVDVQRWVRSWDLAATEQTETNDPDWTAGVKLGRRPSGRIVIAEAIHERMNSFAVRSLVKRTAERDGKLARIRLQQDPGQAGKDQMQSYATMLAGWPVFYRRMTGDKVTRAESFAAQWQAGNVEIVRGPWNDAFLGEMEAFPEAPHDDYVDAACEGFEALPNSGERPDYTKGIGVNRRNDGL